MSDVSPQAICIELSKHESFVAMVELGISRCSRSILAKHKKYIKELKQQLFELTSEGLDDSPQTDEELLASLGL